MQDVSIGGPGSPPPLADVLHDAGLAAINTDPVLVSTSGRAGGEYRSRVAPSDAAFDLIVRGGSVFDGSGSAGVPADIGVRGERIAAIAADLPGHGQRELDARGLAVTPGFIDVHSHDDFAVLLEPGMPFNGWQGLH